MTTVYHIRRIPQCHKSLIISYNEMSTVDSNVLIARGIFPIDTKKFKHG